MVKTVTAEDYRVAAIISTTDTNRSISESGASESVVMEGYQL